MAKHRGRMKPPSLKELNEAIKHIGRVTHKYFLLVNVGSHGLEFGNEDITSIFTQAWITNSVDRDNLRKIFKARQSLPKFK